MADYNDNVSEKGSDSGSGNGSESELEVWREVHSSLLIAIRKAQTAISQSRAQRRFLLEEIAANLNADGTLKCESIWKRPVPLFRHKTTVKSASKGGGAGKPKTGKILLKMSKKIKDLPAEKPAKTPRNKKSDSASEQKVTKKKNPPAPKIVKKQQARKKAGTAISVKKQPLQAVEAPRPASSSDEDNAGKMDQEGLSSNNNSDDEGHNDGEDHDLDEDEDDESAVEEAEEDAGRETNEQERSYAASSWAEMQYQQHPALLVSQQQQQHHHHHQHYPLHLHTQQQQHPPSWGVVPPQTQSQSASQSLQLMAAVAFGAVDRPPPQHQHHPQADHHPAFHQHNRLHHPSTAAHHLPTSHHLAAAAASQGFGWPNSQPQPPHYLNHHHAHLQQQQQQQAAYIVSQAPRNYASLNDIASDEEEEDRF